MSRRCRDRHRADFEQLDFPGLAGRRFALLGMAPNARPATGRPCTGGSSASSAVSWPHANAGMPATGGEAINPDLRGHA